MSKNSHPTVRPIAKSIMARPQNGSSLAVMNCPRVIGVTLSCSSVPSSFSRAMFCALRSVAIIVTSETRIPGTM